MVLGTKRQGYGCKTTRVEKKAKRLGRNVLGGKRLVTAKITENISSGRFLTVDTLQ